MMHSFKSNIAVEITEMGQILTIAPLVVSLYLFDIKLLKIDFRAYFDIFAYMIEYTFNTSKSNRSLQDKESNKETKEKNQKKKKKLQRNNKNILKINYLYFILLAKYILIFYLVSGIFNLYYCALIYSSI